MDDLIKEARDAIQLSYEFDKDNREEAIEDLKFVAGQQWSDAARAERAGRPIITLNRSGQFLRQMANPIRKNMPTIKVEPDGDDDSEMAEIADGLFRRILYNSSASHVFANSVEHMGACGIGWWRIVTDYLNERSFDQEILIKRIFNPMSVYPDPSSLEPDRSDMNWCVVSEVWPLESFKKKWPGKAVTGLDAPGNTSSQQSLSWGAADTVRVAEYWRRKPVTRKIAQLKTGQVVELTGNGEAQIKQLTDLGIIANVRDAQGFKVEMTLVSGAEILEDTYEFPSKWIPIVPIIGAEIPLEQGTYRHGLIRFQREPQRLYNYFMSVAAETLGQQPKSPYLVTQKQIENYKSIWDNANRVPTPYLPYDADPNVPGGQPKRIEPPPLPAGLIQMAQMLSDNQKDATGLYDASLGARSNETSGVAIGARVQQGDDATFHFVDNLEHGLEHTGRIILDMIPKVYDNQRSMRMKADGAAKEKTIVINKPLMSYDGEDTVHNDMSQMSFSSVRVILGQNFASRKAQTSQMLVGLLQAMPQIGAVAGDIIAKNLDIDQADELAERLHALLPPQILQLEQNEDPNAPQQAPQPDPAEQEQRQAASAMVQAEVQEKQANSQAAVTKAQAEKSRADAEDVRLRAEIEKYNGVRLDNALKTKKLSEPPPERASARTDQN